MSRPRSRRMVWVMVAVAAIAAGVTWSVTTSTSLSDKRPERLPMAAPTPTPTPSPTLESLAEPRAEVPVAPPVPAADLVAAAENAATPGMTLGVAVLDVNTGELAEGRDAGRQFMSASLCKLILAVDVLDRHRAEGRRVDPADLDLITRALSDSDDNAMNALWGRYDGAGAVGRVAARLGLTASLPPESSNLWGDALVTAADMVTLHRYVLRDMAPQDGAVIVNALSAANAVATDGFAQHYGLLHQGASPRRYAKQAWVPYAPAGYLLHSSGIAYDGRTGHTYAVALLSIQPYSTDGDARNRLSAIASAALAALTP